MLTKEVIIDAIKTIYDPEIPVNIYDLGLIYNIIIKGEGVHIIMTLTTATCPAAAFMPEEVKTVLFETGKVKNVTVEVVYDPKWSRERMSENAKQQLGFD
jgi:FeS assembly SUF system protein